MSFHLPRYPDAALGLTDIEGRPSSAQTLQSRELAARLGCASHAEATVLVETRLRATHPSLATRCRFSDATDAFVVRTRYLEDAERLQCFVADLVAEHAQARTTSVVSPRPHLTALPAPVRASQPHRQPRRQRPRRAA